MVCSAFTSRLQRKKNRKKRHTHKKNHVSTVRYKIYDRTRSLGWKEEVGEEKIFCHHGIPHTNPLNCATVCREMAANQFCWRENTRRILPGFLLSRMSRQSTNMFLYRGPNVLFIEAPCCAIECFSCGKARLRLSRISKYLCGFKIG